MYRVEIFHRQYDTQTCELQTAISASVNSTVIKHVAHSTSPV